MGVVAAEQLREKPLDTHPDLSAAAALNIAMCPPELLPFQKAMRAESADATYIIQAYVANGLAARGHQLTFIAPATLDEIACTRDPQQPRRAPQTWSKSRWFELAAKASWRAQRWVGVPYLNVFANYRLYDACLRCLPGHDVVYERNGLYKVGVAMACKRLKLPYVLYFEADDVFEHDIMGKPIRGLLRWRAQTAIRYNLHAADCVICVSEQLKHYLTTTWRVPADRIVVFPNVADVRRFRPDPAARSEVRAALGVDGDPLVMFVGNFYEWHDVTTLLDAFAQSARAQPGARLVLVGDGARRAAMMQHAAQLGLDQAVHFTGQVAHAEVPRLLAAADIAVVPYPPLDADLWLSPLKLFEYMAAGKAVIASSVGQLPAVVRDEQNGLLVPPGDAAALASALQRLAADPAFRARLGQQARADAVQFHSWEHYMSRLEKVFVRVIERQPVSGV